FLFSEDLPKFHRLSHASQSWASYGPFIGQTDGESIERAWANSNPFASTREMGVGVRHDPI
ncbi:hypothetical protein C8R43DRAFT_850209, partial [Mycena crocata]